MNYFLDYNGRVIGPMTAMQVMGYNPTYDVRVSLDGVNWQPLYTFPELMSLYNERSKYGEQQQTDSKKTLCGIMAIIFGTLGVQYFVLGKVPAGFITILLSIVTCGAWEIITLIQGIMMLCMSDDEFRRKYIDTTSTFPLF